MFYGLRTQEFKSISQNKNVQENVYRNKQEQNVKEDIPTTI